MNMIILIILTYNYLFYITERIEARKIKLDNFSACYIVMFIHGTSYIWIQEGWLVPWSSATIDRLAVRHERQLQFKDPVSRI